MADEITVTASLRAKKDSAFLDTGTLSYSDTPDMAGTHFSQTVQDIGTTHEAIVIPSELATAGWCYFRNMDPTNYVEVGLDVAAAFVGFLKLLPGEVGLGPLSTKAIYGRANTAAVKLLTYMIER